MTQLKVALLLHPVDEIVVLFGIDAKQLLLDRWILDYDEIPRLAIGARHRPPPDLKNFGDVIVRDRIGLEVAHAHAGFDDFKQGVVVAREVALVHCGFPCSWVAFALPRLRGRAGEAAIPRYQS